MPISSPPEVLPVEIGKHEPVLLHLKPLALPQLLYSLVPEWIFDYVLGRFRAHEQ